jgi:hypothetical protein
MNSEQPPTKPSFLGKISGPLFLLCAIGNLIGLFIERGFTSTAGTIAHGAAVVAFAVFGVFLLRRYYK